MFAALAALAVVAHVAAAANPMTEPYPMLNGGNFSGPAVALSPDPLVQYQVGSVAPQRPKQQ